MASLLPLKSDKLETPARCVERKDKRANPLQLVAVGIALAVLFWLTRLRGLEQISAWRSSIKSHPQQTVAGQPFYPLPSSEESELTTAEDAKCAEISSSDYLKKFSDDSVAYTSPGSRSNITCFHPSRRPNGLADSFCLAQGADFNFTKGKFSLDCSVRGLVPGRREAGLVPYDKLRGYWFSTGLPQVLKKAVEIQTELTHRKEMPREQPDLRGNSPQTFLLVTREGSQDVWPRLMEIFSSWMTTDILGMSRHPQNHNEPFLGVVGDIADTQVVILDDYPDGPFFDLWTLFTQRRPLRLSEIAEDRVAADAIQNANLIVPLADSSNPFWKADWRVQPCRASSTLSVFVNRVLKFYHLGNPLIRLPDSPIFVTFVESPTKRRLRNQIGLLDELWSRNPRISVRLVDVEALPLPEQLRIVRETDVLVGVSGNGLENAIFMREGAGAVVEIQPNEMDSPRYRNMAGLRDLSYLRTHGTSEPIGGESDEAGASNRTGEWVPEEIHLEADRFFNVMNMAIRSLHSTGPWNFDID